MATIGLESASVKAGTAKVGPAQASNDSSRRFSEALEKAASSLDLDPQQAGSQQASSQQVIAQQAQAPSAVSEIRPVSATGQDSITADAQERARRALNLDPVRATQSSRSGDAILHGLEKMRGFFNDHAARINSASSGTAFDINKLFSFQMEVMNFSLVVTVASKLTGHSARAFESLLKGQ